MTLLQRILHFPFSRILKAFTESQVAMLYYSPSKGPKHRWHKDSCGLEQQKITKNHFSPEWSESWNRQSPRRRMPSWKVYPNQNSSFALEIAWNDELFSLHFWQFWCVCIISMYRKKWPMTPEATNPSIRLTGVFFLASQKNGLRPSGYGTCMRAAGRLEDWPCAIFLLQEMQVRIHGWQASRLRCYKDGAKTKKYDVRSSYELQIIPTVSQCLIWIALDLKR